MYANLCRDCECQRDTSDPGDSADEHAERALLVAIDCSTEEQQPKNDVEAVHHLTKAAHSKPSSASVNSDVGKILRIVTNYSIHPPGDEPGNILRPISGPGYHFQAALMCLAHLLRV